MSKIQDHWTHPSQPPRKIQLQAFEWLEKQTVKYLCLELPVGSGKSLAGLSYSVYKDSGHRGDSYIVTPQIILQEQYEKTETKPSEIMKSLKGKSHYKCLNTNTTCDVGRLNGCKDGRNCNYDLARGRALGSPNTILNYPLLFSLSSTDKLKRRQLLILDECHTLESALVSFDALEITVEHCFNIGAVWNESENIEEIHEWVSKIYVPKFAKFLIELAATIDSKRGTITKKALTKIQNEYVALSRQHVNTEAFCLKSVEDIQNNYVLIRETDRLTLKALSADKLFEQYLEPLAEQFLFMSATLNSTQFVSDIGLDATKVSSLSLPSPFDVDNRPIIYIPGCKMNYTWHQKSNEKGRDNLMSQLMKILDIHKDDNGIIHTGNFKISKWVTEELKKRKSTHAILHHNPGGSALRINRSAVISKFMAAKAPTILISPSITEGLSLDDECSRFAIYCKVPFLNLGDKWVKTKQENSSTWYTNQTIIQMLQGSGRIVRSDTDWGVVYIIDVSWKVFFQRNINKFPGWWVDAYSELE